jgi:WD40 repeat protein
MRRCAASASEDDTAKVWDAATGEEVARVGHEGRVWSVVFSPDGHWVALGSADSTARVWMWRPEDLIAGACARLPRNLTLEEWEMYLPDKPYRPTCLNLSVPEE